jgi:hypothetical protein
MNRIANLFQLVVEIAVGRPECRSINDERRTDDYQRCTASCALNRLIDGQAANGLDRNRDGSDDAIQLVERAEPADHPTLVEADVMDDDIHAEALEPLRALDPVVGAEIVSHHLDVEIAACVDDAADGGLVRAAHDDDEVGAGLRHHLRLEIAAVHRLQISNDGMVRKTGTQFLDGVEPFGQEQGRAGFKPVDSGLDADRGGLDRFVHVDEIQRELDDGVFLFLEFHEVNVRGRGRE